MPKALNWKPLIPIHNNEKVQAIRDSENKRIMSACLSLKRVKQNANVSYDNKVILINCSLRWNTKQMYLAKVVVDAAVFKSFQEFSRIFDDKVSRVLIFKIWSQNEKLQSDEWFADLPIVKFVKFCERKYGKKFQFTL